MQTDGFSVFTCHLSILSPSYRTWHKVFGDDEVPLLHALPLNGMLHDKAITVYEIDCRRLSLAQLTALLEMICIGMQTDDIKKATEYLALRQMSFPIPVGDVNVKLHSQEEKK